MSVTQWSRQRRKGRLLVCNTSPLYSRGTRDRLKDSVSQVLKLFWFCDFVSYTFYVKLGGQRSLQVTTGVVYERPGGSGLLFGGQNTDMTSPISGSTFPSTHRNLQTKNISKLTQDNIVGVRYRLDSTLDYSPSILWQNTWGNLVNIEEKLTLKVEGFTMTVYDKGNQSRC